MDAGKTTPTLAGRPLQTPREFATHMAGLLTIDEMEAATVARDTAIAEEAARIAEGYACADLECNRPECMRPRSAAEEIRKIVRP